MTFVGYSTQTATALADALDMTTRLVPPTVPDRSDWAWDWRRVIDRWRNEIVDQPPADDVVVCTWPPSVTPAPLVEIAPDRWRAEVEWPLALWFQTLVAAATRCAEGGSVVAVIELPAAVDASGHAPVVAVAEGLLTLVRSLAASHGGRRVRVNAVTTELFTAPSVLTGAPPPLASFPGRPDIEVAGAVAMLRSPLGSGVTGSTLRAAGGRP